MKTKDLKSVAFNLLMIFGIVALNPVPALALDPSQENSSCFNGEKTSSEGRPCSVVNCEWENLEKDFLGESEGLEDCSAEAASSSLLRNLIELGVWFIAGTVIAFAGALGLTFITKKKTTKKPKN